MSAGYEARARITTDVSGFVSGARSVASSANTAAAAIRALSTQIAVQQRLLSSSVAGVRAYQRGVAGLNQAQASANTTAQSGLAAARQMASAYNQGAQAQQAAAHAATQQAQAQTQSTRTTRQATQSTQAMGREMEKLSQQRRVLMAQQRNQGALNESEQAALAVLRERLRELGRRYAGLDDEQRKAVDSARAMAQAQNTVAGSTSVMGREIRQAAQEQARAAKAAELSEAALRSQGREMARLSAQRRTLTDAQRSGVALTSAEQQALSQLRDRLRELGQTAAGYSAAQRAVVDGARNAAQAQAAVAAATSRATSAMRDQTNVGLALDNSLWSIRSSLGDLQGFLTQITSGFRNMATELATTFSAQEMAIAHISRVTQATKQEMDIITAGVRELATEIPLAFEELGQIAQLGAQVGIAKDSLVDFTETVALFAATTDVTAESASMMFARIQQMTDIDDTQFRNLGSAVSELGSNMTATEREILTVTESIATVASQAGMTGRAIVGLGAAMASLRIQPELARGAVQRVFLQLSTVVAESGAEMERLAEITGHTTDELAAMESSNFDQFIMTVFEGLSRTAESGQNLVPVLRELGIYNTRDADAVARLAANYDLLTYAMETAGESFEQGNYLQREASRIFDTLTAKTQLMSNAWDELKFSLVAAVGPLVTWLVEGVTAVIQFVSGSELLVAVLGRLLIVGGVVAGFAALVAIVSSAIQAWIALRTVLATAAVAMGAMSSSAAAGATTVGLLGGMLGGAARNARDSAKEMGAAGVAARGFAGALRLIGTVGAIGVILGLVEGLRLLSQSAIEANQAHLDAAGGLESLKQAMLDDTQAALDSGSALVYRRQAVEEMSDEDIAAAEAAEGLAARQRVLATQLGTLSAEMVSAQGATSGTAGSMDELASVAERAGFAIGEANQRFAALAVESVITESGVLKNRNAFQALTRELEQFGGLAGLIEMELRDAGSATAELNDLWWEFADNLSFFERLGADTASVLYKITGGLLDWRGESALTLDAIELLAGGFEGITEAQIEAINALELFEGKLQIAEDGSVELVGGLDELSGGLDGVEGSAEGAGDAIASFAEGVASAFGSVSQLGEGLEEEEQNLANYTAQLEDMMEARVNFAANLMELQGRVSDESLALMAQNAEQFAPIVEELAGAGDEVVQGFDEMLSFLEPGGELNTRYQTAMEELTTISADSADGIVTAQLERLNKLWDEGKIGPREYVEELEALLNSTTKGFSGVAQEQVDALTSMFDGGIISAGAFANALITRFNEAGDVTSVAIAGQIEYVKGLFDAGAIDAAEMVERIETILSEGSYDIEPRVDPDEAVDGAHAVAGEVELIANNSDPTFDPRVDPEQAESQMDALDGAIITTADLSDPTFKPRTDGRGAESEMGTTTRAIERTANTSKPTVKPRTDGSQARTDMSGIMSTLRGMASTIWVSIRGTMGGIFGGGRKDGGWVQGPGGPRQDNIAMMLSSDEYVVNARAAKAYAPVLEWINNQGLSSAPVVPNYIPADIMAMPHQELRNSPAPQLNMPEGLAQAMRTNSVAAGPRMVINVYNTYPQAEPTSVTVNRSLSYAAALGGI